MLDKILGNFQKSSGRSKIYAAFIALVFILTIFFFIRALVFIVSMVDLAKGEAEESEEAVFLKFNLDGFAPLAPRLRISLSPASATDETLPAPVASSTPEAAASSSAISESPIPAKRPEETRIQILNGTKIPGLAKSWQEKFAVKNFKEIITGNYTAAVSGTQINYRPDAQSVLPVVKEVLTAGGIDAGSTTEKEDASQSPDIIIILGQ